MSVDAWEIQEALVRQAAAGMPNVRAFDDYESITPGAFGAVVVTEMEADYSLTMNGLLGLQVTVGTFFGRGNMLQARKALSRAMSPDGEGSLYAALMPARGTPPGTPVLGGAAKTINVGKARGAYRIYTVGSQSMLGAMFDVEVWA